VPIKRSIILESLKRHEGYRKHPYVDTVGKLTVGHGRNLDDVGISRDEAAMLLEGDVTAAIALCLQAWPWLSGLDDVRSAVIVEMAVNLGIDGLKGFKQMIAAVERALAAKDPAVAQREFAAAAAHGIDSLWRAQVGARAYRLMAQLASGKIPPI
jgi:lysozyme